MNQSWNDRVKIPVGILGATGVVGQRFVSLLTKHPWFDLAVVTASERTAGKPYGDVVQWMLPEPLPPKATSMEVRPTTAALPCRLLFSALDAAIAGPLEVELAMAGHFVISNARCHRMASDVPLVVPEVNPDHLDLVHCQSYGGGAIVTNPNCSTVGLVLALKPLLDAFGLQAVHVVTLQALSGAGLPGVPGVAAVDNTIPFIAGEEEKLETEPLKVLGTLEGGKVKQASLTVSAQCNRVGVVEGHTECVSVRLGRSARLEEVRAALADFAAESQVRQLPSSPPRPIEVTPLADRPQARLDRDRGRGMTVTVGRLQRCPLLDYKFVLLSHNTVRGAAGGAVLLAELAVARRLLSAKEAVPQWSG